MSQLKTSVRRRKFARDADVVEDDVELDVPNQARPQKLTPMTWKIERPKKTGKTSVTKCAKMKGTSTTTKKKLWSP
jgi:hypothetical protein